MSDLPFEYLDPQTPPDVVVTDRARPPITDPTLGEPLGLPAANLPAVPAQVTHRLVTVGDSLTHGMSSAAVFRTDLSWPVLAGESLRTSVVVPTYGGPLGGLPLNLEGLLRRLQQRFGTDIDLLETFSLPLALHELADANEDYWERGDGSKPPRTDIRYENLGIYGWDVRDALSFTADDATQALSEPARDQFLGAKPDHDNDIAALSVLAPFGGGATQLAAAEWHGENGGIDTLAVVLGANNVLRSVVDKEVAWSGPGFDTLNGKHGYTVWRPTHFGSEFWELVDAVRAIPARRVVLATVPHVTIAPITNGVNPERPGEKWRDGSRYFPYYTDPWIEERDFRPDRHRHLTHQQVRAIDSAIDQFNDVIAAAVRLARREGRPWLLLDLCGVLDGLAARRYLNDPAAAAANEWQPYPVPAAISDLTTRFFLSDSQGRIQGGLFGLDAVHPTTSGYGILAQAFLDVIAADGVASTQVDFEMLRGRDTLNSQPPALLRQMLGMLSPFLVRFLTRR